MCGVSVTGCNKELKIWRGSGECPEQCQKIIKNDYILFDAEEFDKLFNIP